VFGSEIKLSNRIISGLASKVSAFMMPFLYHLSFFCTKFTDEPEVYEQSFQWAKKELKRLITLEGEVLDFLQFTKQRLRWNCNRPCGVTAK
jgi:transposase